MTDTPTFTILTPVNRPPDLMPYAIRSVLAQTRQDFELFIVCDGAPDATADTARAFEAQDPRIRAFIHDKGERHGEAYRHQALQHARGRVVCQIGDDDLWFPDHLEVVDNLIAGADFGSTLPMYLQADGEPRLHFIDSADPAVQRQMTGGYGNAFGPTPAAYRLETYRSLPVGWSPAPEGTWTDLFMWRKFLALPGIRCATHFAATTLTFPQALRRDWSLERRRQEIAAVAPRIADPDARQALFRDALAAAARRMVALQVELSGLRTIGQTLLSAVEDADSALMGIVGAQDAETQARLAQEARSRLPDPAWRRRLGGAPADTRRPDDARRRPA